jgi:hypothetical protein
MNKITLLSTGLILTGVLTACNSTVKPDCWKATHNTINKDCNSGGSGVSVKSPSIKDKIGKKDTPTKDIPSVDTPSVDNPPNNTTPEAPSEDPAPEDTTQDNTDQQDDTPLQSDSNDVEGFDPSSGLYGPGT